MATGADTVCVDKYAQTRDFYTVLHWRQLGTDQDRQYPCASTGDCSHLFASERGDEKSQRSFICFERVLYSWVLQWMALCNSGVWLKIWFAYFWLGWCVSQLKPLRVIKLLRILKTMQLIGCIYTQRSVLSSEYISSFHLHAILAFLAKCSQSCLCYKTSNSAVLACVI